MRYWIKMRGAPWREIPHKLYAAYMECATTGCLVGRFEGALLLAAPADWQPPQESLKAMLEKYGEVVAA